MTSGDWKQRRTVKMRVLCVGDEPEIAEHFRDPEAAEDAGYEVRFVEDTEQAIAHLTRSRFDVVMAGHAPDSTAMDDLLLRVRADHPQTAWMSIVDSSSSVAKPEVGTFALLPKRCDAVTLQALVDRSFNLHQLLTSDVLHRVAGGVATLPSVPQAYWELTKVAANPEAGIAEIAVIVESDPAMSLKILQLVNSAFFGLPQRTTSIPRAISYLGIELLKSLVLTAHVFSAFEGNEIKGFSLSHFQMYSVRMARLVRKMITSKTLEEEAFTTGMVHDIGKLILAMSQPFLFEKVLTKMSYERRPLQDIEREVLGVTHAEVGAYLLSTWGIPFSIVESVAHHHHPRCVVAGEREVLAVIHAADALVGIFERRENESALDVDFIADAGFADALPDWRKLVKQEWAQESGR